MGKNHRKQSEVRGPASANAATQRKFISKKKSKSQIKAVNDTVTRGLQGVSIFDQLNDTNQRGQTKSLMALSAVSFTEGMPIEMFYDPKTLQRVMELANQLQHQVNLMAMDALRNLFVQAHLIDSPQHAQKLLDLGLFSTMEQVVGKAIKQLQFERDNTADSNTRERQTRIEGYHIVVQQAFVCLSDICHFIEHGQILQELTQSELVTKSMSLVRNCRDFADILNSRIFQSISVFLRELSNDNEYVKNLDIVGTGFAQIVEDPSLMTVTTENVDFYWNLLEFHFNVIIEKEGQVGVFARLDFYLSKIAQLLGGVGQAAAQASDPVGFFKTNFLHKYKLADMFAQGGKGGASSLTIDEEEFKGQQVAQDDNDDEEEVTMQEIDDEDQVAKQEPQFKEWIQNLQAQTNCMRMLLKLADFLDTSKVDDRSNSDDEDFEDCDEMEDDGDATQQSAQVIDLDAQKSQCLAAVFGYLDHVLLRTQPLPQLISFQRDAADALDEMQETAFAVLTSLLFSKMTQVKEAIKAREGDILQAVMNFVQLATFKCERPSSENAAECLSALAIFSESARQAIFGKEHLMRVAQFGYYMPSTAVMAKLYIIQTFQRVLSTSVETVPQVLVTQDHALITEVTKLILESCQVADLVLISGALDALFDIFSEENYNTSLLERNVVQLMAQGAPTLSALYQKCKQEKTLNRNELANAENALENVMPFIEYKKGVMNLNF